LALSKNENAVFASFDTAVRERSKIHGRISRLVTAILSNPYQKIKYCEICKSV
jgi:hypothetical protein